MSFETDRYEVIRGALSGTFLAAAQSYYQTLLLQDKFRPAQLKAVPKGAFDRYCDALSTTIQEMLHPVMETCTGLRLLPTYNYTRVYPPGAVLVPHTDRPACEISATLTIRNYPAEVWPIFLRRKDNTTARVDLEPGDMLVYCGMELPHWREAGTVEQTGIFMHWVDANGRYTDHHGDPKRRYSPRNIGILDERRATKTASAAEPQFEFK